METIENPEEKILYFMSLDHVKWRRPVIPGDQIRFELGCCRFAGGPAGCVALARSMGRWSPKRR